MFFDGRNDFSSIWTIFASSISSQNAYLGGAAETRKCGNVAPASVWATVAKTQVLRQAGLQDPAFWETHVFPANNAENKKRSIFNNHLKNAGRAIPQGKCVGKLNAEKKHLAAKLLPPEGFHQIDAPALVSGAQKRLPPGFGEAPS